MHCAPQLALGTLLSDVKLVRALQSVSLGAVVGPLRPVHA